MGNVSESTVKHLRNWGCRLITERKPLLSELVETLDIVFVARGEDGMIINYNRKAAKVGALTPCNGRTYLTKGSKDTYPIMDFSPEVTLKVFNEQKSSLNIIKTIDGVEYRFDKLPQRDTENAVFSVAEFSLRLDDASAEQVLFYQRKINYYLMKELAQEKSFQITGGNRW